MGSTPDLSRPQRVVSIPVEVSPGELIDRLTILDIKRERLTELESLRSVRAQARILEAARRRFVPSSVELRTLASELRAVNEELWDIEDEIRLLEREGRFDDDFIALARAVYTTNDRRAELKRRIDRLLGAAFFEVKSHAERPHTGPVDG